MLAQEARASPRLPKGSCCSWFVSRSTFLTSLGCGVPLWGSSRAHRGRTLCRPYSDAPSRSFPPSPALHLGDLIPLAVASHPLADVEQQGEKHPEPIPADQSDAGRVNDYIDQGRKGEEDDAQQ